MRLINFTSISDSLAFWCMMTIVVVGLFPAWFDHYLVINSDGTALLVYVEGFLSGLVLGRLLGRLSIAAKVKE